MTKPQREYYFYIVASRSRTMYCGVTSKLEKRIWEHKNHVISGFTSRYHIERLVYLERYSDIRSAVDREKQVKRWSRAKKLALIERFNPTWLDLSGWGYYKLRTWSETQNADPSTCAQSTSSFALRSG